MTDLTIDRASRRRGAVRWSGALATARGLLRADAALCLFSGAGLLAAAPAAASLVDGRPVGVVQVVGGGLTIYAVELWLLARAGAERLAALLRAVAVLNVAWLVATAAVVISGVLTPAGAALALGAAVPVALLARAELGAARVAAERVARLHVLTGADADAGDDDSIDTHATAVEDRTDKEIQP